MGPQVDLAPHPVFGFVLQVADAENFPWALGLESLDPFLRVSKEGLCLTADVEGRGDKKLVQLELAYEADGVAPPYPV